MRPPCHGPSSARQPVPTTDLAPMLAVAIVLVKASRSTHAAPPQALSAPIAMRLARRLPRGARWRPAPSSRRTICRGPLALQLDMDTLVKLDALCAMRACCRSPRSPPDRLAPLLGEVPPVDDRCGRLARPSWGTLVTRAVETVLHRGELAWSHGVVGPSPQESGTMVDIVLAEAPLWVDMVQYSVRILTLSWCSLCSSPRFCSWVCRA